MSGGDGHHNESETPRREISPKARAAWGRALVRTGAKFDDQRLATAGWSAIRAARGDSRALQGKDVDAVSTTSDAEEKFSPMPETPQRNLTNSRYTKIDRICGDLALIVLSLAMAIWVGATWHRAFTLRGGGGTAVALTIMAVVLSVLSTAGFIRWMHARNERFGALALIVVVGGVAVAFFSAVG